MSIHRPTLLLGSAIGFLLTLSSASADTPKQVHPDGGNAAEVGRKLSDPTSNIWALFTEFDISFSDGDLNEGDDRVGGDMIFQPIMPFPLYGEGDDQWKLITRPTVPLAFSVPVPRGNDDFYNVGGLADTTIPMMVSPPMGENWIFGVGPGVLLPTATRDELGREQFGLGPSGVIGYKTKKYTIGVFPQYYYKIGSLGDQDDREPANFMNLLYFGFLNLPNAWQIGFNPTITYDRRQDRDNRWNVPIGMIGTKTMPIGGVPVKLQFGLEYSVVHQDDFGKRALFKLNVIPVIPSLVKNPIFGGK